jgi:hypothetical protein
MERIVYTSKYGDKIVEDVERFDIRGTIMGASVHKVGDCTLHRLFVEDGKGKYHISVWDSARGYDRDALKQGRSVRFRGLIHRQGYMGEDGTPKSFKDYKAQEMMA